VVGVKGYVLAGVEIGVLSRVFSCIFFPQFFCNFFSIFFHIFAFHALLMRLGVNFVAQFARKLGWARARAEQSRAEQAQPEILAKKCFLSQIRIGSGWLIFGGWLNTSSHTIFFFWGFYSLQKTYRTAVRLDVSAVGAAFGATRFFRYHQYY